MDARIQAILEEKMPLIERLTKLTAAISALQEVCNHEWQYDGHESGHAYYLCSKCGKERQH